MTDYAWRMHIVVPASHAAPAGEAAAQTLPGGEAERAMFGVPLRRTRVPGGDEAMLACSILLTEAQRAALMSAFARMGVQAVWARMDAGDGRLAGASTGLAVTEARKWDWDDTLAATACRPMTEVTDGG